MGKKTINTNYRLLDLCAGLFHRLTGGAEYNSFKEAENSLKSKGYRYIGKIITRKKIYSVCGTEYDVSEHYVYYCPNHWSGCDFTLIYPYNFCGRTLYEICKIFTEGKWSEYKYPYPIDGEVELIPKTERGKR